MTPGDAMLTSRAPHVWVETIGWVLVHSLWQGTLLALALALLLGILPRARSGVRYAAACITMLGMLAFPLATGLRTAYHHQWTRATTGAKPLAGGSSPAQAGEGMNNAPAAEPPNLFPARIRLLATHEDFATALRPLVPPLTYVWMLGALVLSLRLTGGWLLNRALVRRDTCAPPPEWLDIVARLCRTLDVGRPVRLLLSSRVVAPVLVGWWRPIVLLPTSAITGLAPWQLELLLRHEIAHVRRYDSLVNLLQCVAEVLLFHHPAAWWVSRQIRTEREHCCDDEVAAAVGVSRYVRALVAMEELRAGSGRASLHLAIGADGGSLLARVQRLMGTSGPTPRRWVGQPRSVLTTMAMAGPLAAVLLGLLVADAVRSPAYRRVPPATHDSTATPTAWPTLLAACDAASSRDGTTLCAPLTRRVTDLLRRENTMGAVVVQDVATGAVISYTSASRTAEPRVTDVMPPASIWKLSLAAIWWEQGFANATIPCPKRLVIDGRVIEHWGTPHPAMNAANMLVESCNTAAATMALTLRDHLGPQGMRDAFRRMGFPVSMPSVTGDRLGDSTFWATVSPAWRERMSPDRMVLRLPADEDDAGWASLALGAGVELSPLHVARFLQAIGHDGLMRRPTIERGFAMQAEAGHRIMSAATAQRLRAAMRDVVQRGTARKTASLLEPARWSLSGKTGTGTSHGSERIDGWFTGLLLDESQVPRYAVVVVVHGRGPGSGAAASIAAELTRALGGDARQSERPRGPTQAAFAFRGT
jgi:beta-lactamase regulating signal transducer with metallopeptidase domain